MRFFKKLISLALVLLVLVAIAVPVLAQAQNPLPPDAIKAAPGQLGV
ncbi:hypothetical protein [Chroococcidiopsis thermalis]|jgi:hypothetical protein|uniref:Response regulator containing a CheY-like receiver domain protein and an HTH DNA-binding domain protein n=1 Tax=Chroococcidiopsis thermalis (strain PCC 7203) TaxID=251229 RepID=K9U4F2_CHRTP|nr:hypothetical protein [Chroococcidiopsis thermalis]AFY89276.1 response regulator containing a CheY-like receiver domain protein and an HTH DNA-binding domain protein [Chroococcidiopsis thermalis PCC 7203]